jgi:hypothetical protein
MGSDDLFHAVHDHTGAAPLVVVTGLSATALRQASLRIFHVSFQLIGAFTTAALAACIGIDVLPTAWSLSLPDMVTLPIGAFLGAAAVSLFAWRAVSSGACVNVASSRLVPTEL